MANVHVFVTGPHCFIPHPSGLKGHWMRTNRCVAFIACPMCNAKVGEACTGSRRASDAMGRTSSVHTARGDAYRRYKRDHPLDAKRVVVTVEDSHGAGG